MAHFIQQNQIEENQKAPHKERWRAELRKSLHIPGTSRSSIKEQLQVIETGRKYTKEVRNTPGAISKETKRYASCCRIRK